MPPNGNVATVPMRQASQVTCSPGTRRSTTFCASIATAYTAALSSTSRTPATSASPVLVAIPITRVPAKAISPPMTSILGNPSPSTSPASTPIRIGATWISIEAVPASTCCSPALRATL